MVSSASLVVEEIVGDLSVLINKPSSPIALTLLAHGAGAGMQHPFMQGLSEQLSQHQIATIRFNFPYMDAGKKLPGSPKPNKEAIKKMAAYAKKRFPQLPLFLSGKSYGGRMSSEVMAETPISYVRGLIFYGFPLHAPGKPSTKRAEHLKDAHYSMLFIQGENDKLADLDLMKEVTKSLTSSTLKTYEHADHSFKRPKKISAESLIPELAHATQLWITKVLDLEKV